LFITAFFIIPIIIVNKKGLYPMKKVAVIFFPILIISIACLLFATSNTFSINNFLPIFGNNLENTFTKGFQNIFIFNFILIYFFLMPILQKKNDYKKIMYLSFGINLILIITSIIAIFLYFPSNVNTSIQNLNVLNNIYLITRKIQINTFLSQTDAIFLFFWSFAILSYICLGVYAITYILDKLFHYKNKSQTTFALSPIILGFSLIIYKTSIIEILENYIFKYLSIILIFIVCFFILILGYLKKLFSNRSRI
jgi:hypothetical protein